VTPSGEVLVCKTKTDVYEGLVLPVLIH